MRKLTLGILIAAAILLPIAMVAGVVESFANNPEVQKTAEPTAKISAKNVEKTSVVANITVDRSQYVFLPGYQGDEETGQKYYYGQSYRICLIDMTAYEKADAEAKKSSEQSSVSIASFVKNVFDIEQTSRPQPGYAPKDEKNDVSFNVTDTYTFTTDTQVQEKKKYYTKNDSGEFVVADLEVGSSIKSNTYYEATSTTNFSFKVVNLLSNHKYAFAVQFYFSMNDAKNEMYNKSYQQRTTFTTK